MNPSPARILVVDDEATARVLIGATLRKAGFDVELAVGGEDALARFDAHPADCVMLDVDMPDLNGHEVCVRLRARAGALLPILMVTGMDDVDSVEHAYEAGATDFIAKPVNWAVLGHRVRYLLRSYRAMQDLQAAQARHAAVLNAIPDLLFELDSDHRFIDYHSPRSDLLATTPDRFLGRTVSEILPGEAAQACVSALRTAADTGVSTGAQYALQIGQSTRWFELSVARKASADAQRPHFIALSRDITERKDAEERITQLAYFDSLTGLPNRRAFLERMARETRRARQGGHRLGLLFMDLDGFKQVNDTLGHRVGDLILQSAAERLRQTLRSSDMLARIGVPATTVELARLGGDEFTALICGIESEDQMRAIAVRIVDAMRRPFEAEDRMLTLTTSVGISIFPDDGTDAETLLKYADTAMYHAKNSGRNNSQRYNATLTEQAVRRMELDSSLRSALENGELRVVYQPQIDVKTNRVGCVEALLRWQHPTRGEVLPAEFVPLAEENGLIVPIGRWVLRQTCADAMRWHRAGHAIGVAVNLSPAQFSHPDLLDDVVQALAETGLAPRWLEVEVTESALMKDAGSVIGTLTALRDHGIRIALDDFGTGYSSLSYLTRMPIHALKVDRSFVAGLLDEGHNGTIVRAILAMAESLGMRVTAEGVETLEQARALRAMSCDGLQGYYFCRPVAPDEVPAQLARNWGLAPMLLAG